MKKIWHYLKNHLRHDFKGSHYLVVFFILFGALTFNYSLDFEDNYLENLDANVKIFGYLLLYAIPYFLTCLSYAFFFSQWHFLSTIKFWLFSFFGLMILSIDSSLPFLEYVVADLVPAEIQFWMYKVSINAISFITVFLPILLF